jgi:hypothetical protein
MNELDILCRCGHAKKEHLDDGIFSDCLVTYKAQKEDCGCMKYVPDNLSYIEDLAKERKLI